MKPDEAPQPAIDPDPDRDPDPDPDPAVDFVTGSPDAGPCPGFDGTTRWRSEPAAAPEAPPGAGPTSAGGAAPAEGPGLRIGPYRLLQRIGQGGMGTVFMAEQERPIRRKVALKVIRFGMDTGQVVARFEAERQALALMDHPHIARALDAGATDTGRPFFVMELVRGVPITEYCDRNRLGPRERLELFIPVCRAIQHAHQKGIIHRDIKPSNVLVTLHDGVPEPKVIDFGVAKAVDQRLTERTMFTEFGAIIGTLEYMSPEQAEMGALDVDTRSDIYSLGVLLYELLTGTTPLGGGSAETCQANLLGRIRDEEPPRPSARLASLRAGQAPTAARLGLEPARLVHLLRGDLDWIVMKAIEKDRTRRYETANGLARDVQRHLEGDAVEASPPSPWYKLGKFAGRHRAALATAAAFAALLVAATALSAALAVRANDQRARAEAAEESAGRQRDRAQDREQSANRQRLRAEAAEAMAKERLAWVSDGQRLAVGAVRRYSDTVRDTPELRNDPNLAPLRRKLLREPKAFYQQLRDRLQANRDTSPGSLALLAEANFDLGKLTDEIGDRLDALKAWDESRLIWERLLRDDPTNPRYRADLANTHLAAGTLQHYLNRLEQALASFRAALAIYERLAADHPAAKDYQQNHAWSRAHLAAVQADMGSRVEASASVAEVHAVRELLAWESPTDPRFQFDLAASHNAVGEMLRSQGQVAEALAAHEQARSICERLVRDEPSDVAFRNELATSLQQIGQAQAKDHRISAALASHEQARAIWEELAREHPSSAGPQSGLISCHYYIGLTHYHMGNWDEATASFARRRQIYERLARDDPTNPKVQAQLAICHHNDGLVLLRAGRLAEALRPFEQARAILERLARDDPADARLRSSLPLCYHTLGEAHRLLGRPTEALAWFEQARATAAQLVLEQPTNARWLDALTRAAIDLGLAHRDAGAAAEAARWREQARGTQARRIALDQGTAPPDAKRAAVSPDVPPRDNAERLARAVRAYEQGLPAESARLYAEALADDPRLAEDRKARHPYNAACSAARAGTGRGCDDPPPDEAAQARLRRQALAWLAAELDAWTRVAEANTPHLNDRVALELNHWKGDEDLDGLREGRDLDQLAEPERATARRLWAEVDRLLARVKHQP